MIKRETIKLETIAKAVSHDPQMFMDDLLEIHVKFKSFYLKYGDLGLKTLLQALEKDK